MALFSYIFLGSWGLFPYETHDFQFLEVSNYPIYFLSSYNIYVLVLEVGGYLNFHIFFGLFFFFNQHLCFCIQIDYLNLCSVLSVEFSCQLSTSNTIFVVVWMFLLPIFVFFLNYNVLFLFHVGNFFSDMLKIWMVILRGHGCCLWL